MLEAKSVAKVEADLNSFDAMLAGSADLTRLIGSPVFSTEEQVRAISAIVDKAKIGGLAGDFLRVVAGNRHGDVPHRPLGFFTLLVEMQPYAMVFSRSLFVSLLDRAERLIPSLTPESMKDDKPLMRPPVYKAVALNATEACCRDRACEPCAPLEACLRSPASCPDEIHLRDLHG